MTTTKLIAQLEDTTDSTLGRTVLIENGDELDTIEAPDPTEDTQEWIDRFDSIVKRHGYRRTSEFRDGGYTCDLETI